MKRNKRRQSTFGPMWFAALVAALVASSWDLNNTSALTTAGMHPTEIRLEARQRDASGQASESMVDLDPGKTAIVVVDMWTAHTCSAATTTMLALIPPMNRTLDAARNLGIQVIFAASGDDLKRWENRPQRLRILALPEYPLPPSNGFMKGAQPYGPFPASCMCKVTQLKAGTNEPLLQCQRMKSDHNQNPGLVVRDQDLFVAAGHYRPGIKWAIDSWGEPAQQEIWNFVQSRSISTLVYMGVSTNMCVINREFGMIEMRRLGLKTLFIRDLTGSMTYDGYNPITKKLDPAWTPAVGTEYAVQFIEENIGPSITSKELIRNSSRP